MLSRASRSVIGEGPFYIIRERGESESYLEIRSQEGEVSDSINNSLKVLEYLQHSSKIIFS